MEFYLLCLVILSGGYSALLETRRLSRKAIAQHLAGYQAGASTSQLAATFGISKTSVRRLRQAHWATSSIQVPKTVWYRVRSAHEPGRR